MKKTGIAFIGFGGMGVWHSNLLKRMDELELVGVYDIKDDRCELAHSQGIYTYDSMQDLLDDEKVEIVSVIIPNHLHKEVCIQAMRAGKHVVCEKPVALNSQELEEMIAVSKECGVIFTVHQNRRWDEDYRTARHIIENNLLGKTFRIESRVHGSRGIPGDWRNQKQFGGGMVLDWGVHLLDQILQMVDRKLLSVYATLSYVTNENCDDGFTVTLRFADDLTVVVEVGTSNFIGLPRWYILGENGSAQIDNFAVDGKIVMVSDWEKRDAVPVVTAAGLTKTMAPRTKDTIQEYPLPKQHADVREFYRNVVKACHGEEVQLVKHGELLRVMKLMEAIFESAQLNKVITDFEERCK